MKSRGIYFLQSFKTISTMTGIFLKLLFAIFPDCFFTQYYNLSLGCKRDWAKLSKKQTVAFLLSFDARCFEKKNYWLVLLFQIVNR